MRAKDWSTTALGPVDAWPQSLKTIVGVLLTSRFAMWMGWGPDITFMYNDAYGKMTLGAKHPWALGRPSHEVWAEIWSEIRPRITRVLRDGEATWDQDLLLFLERSGYREETYHTFSYSPVRDDTSAIRGLLCVVSEETERVIGERRMGILRDTAAALAATATEAELFAALERALAGSRDLPFTLIYLLDDSGRCALVARSGIAATHPAAAAIVQLDDDAAPWPLAAAQGAPVVVELSDRVAPLPTGPWPEAPKHAIIAPIEQSGQGCAGVIVAGLNPYRPFDDAYRSFVDLFVGQIAAGLAKVRTYEEERRRATALAELDRAKTTFFSNVSHEFRTPLTLLMGPIEELQRMGDALPAKVQEQLDVSHRNSLRLLKLVNTLLEFSRIEAGRVRAQFEPVDLAAFTADLASTFRSAMDRAGLDYRVETRAAAAARLSRSRDVGEGRAEPGLQRVQVHAQRARPRPHRRRRRSRGADGRRHRRRHPGERAAAHLRTLPSCRRHAREKPRGLGNRAGAGAGARTAARRRAHGGEPGRAGDDVSRRPAVRPGAPAAGSDRAAPGCGGTGVSGVVRRRSDAVAAGRGWRGERRERRGRGSGRPAGRHCPCAARRRQPRHARLRAAAARRALGRGGGRKRAAGARRGAGAAPGPHRHRRDDAGARRLRAAAGAACRRVAAVHPGDHAVGPRRRGGAARGAGGVGRRLPDQAVHGPRSDRARRRAAGEGEGARPRAAARRADGEPLLERAGGDRAAARPRSRLRAGESALSRSRRRPRRRRPADSRGAAGARGSRHLRSARRRARHRASRSSAGRCG